VLVNQPIPLADILAVSFPIQEKLVEAKASLAGYDCSGFGIESGLF